MVIESSSRFDFTRSIETDVCIIGGGVAGITIAMNLARRGIRVRLLEGGGESFSRRSQELYNGETWDHRYSLTGTRTRMLGGSSNCWGGWTRPPSAVDFTRRGWLGGFGWPIEGADLAPFHAEAARLLELSPPESDAEVMAALDPEAARAARIGDPELRTVFLHLSPPTAFGKVYRDELSGLATLGTVTDATVTRLVTDPATDRVTAVEGVTPGGRFRVSATLVILAAGGIENPRLLLASGGIGNGHDLVGRYFMDHPRIRLRHLVLDEAASVASLYDMRHYGGGSMVRGRGRVGAALMPSPEAQRAAGLLQSYTGLVAFFFGQSDSTLEDARQVYKAVRGRLHERIDAARLGRVVTEMPAAMAYLVGRRLDMRGRRMRFEVETVMEPMPDRDNRVELGRERDRNGVPKVRLTWRRHEVERRTHEHALGLVARAFEASGQGRMQIRPDAFEPDVWDRSVMTTWHHMGTTRMAAAPSEGVVDADCRVFGTSNLYVAGSSVFASGGGVPPTLMLTMLALRLADHVAGELAQGRHGGQHGGQHGAGRSVAVG
ncbi:MAG TPA: GMC family oxidoreductase [Amaricoccus sp.]|nr:GMC family oxidoreductase [Amaricoccus sp.]